MLQPSDLRRVRDNAVEIANNLSSKTEVERLGKIAFFRYFSRVLSLFSSRFIVILAGSKKNPSKI